MSLSQGLPNERFGVGQYNITEELKTQEHKDKMGQSLQQKMSLSHEKSKNQKILEELNERDDELDFYGNATNDRIYSEPDCLAIKNKTYLMMQTEFDGHFLKFNAAKAPVLLAAANGNITTYAPLDIKALEKSMKPITKVLEIYKQKLYCDKFIKDYGRDLEELAKVNNSKVEKYTELVK